jgi:hypothetical protein
VEKPTVIAAFCASATVPSLLSTQEFASCKDICALKFIAFTRSSCSYFLSLVSGLVPSAFCSTTYTTNFSLTENPISENGKWIDGKAVGLDWANVRTSPGLAYGTPTDTIQYDDSTAVLTGTWGQDQSAWATVHTVNQTSALVEEVEIRLRTTALSTCKSCAGMALWEISHLLIPAQAQVYTTET